MCLLRKSRTRLRPRREAAHPVARQGKRAASDREGSLLTERADLFDCIGRRRQSRSSRSSFALFASFSGSEKEGSVFPRRYATSLSTRYGDSLSRLTHRKYAFGYFRQRDGQSPSAVRASAKRSGADAIVDSSLFEGAFGGGVSEFVCEKKREDCVINRYNRSFFSAVSFDIIIASKARRARSHAEIQGGRRLCSVPYVRL